MNSAPTHPAPSSTKMHAVKREPEPRVQRMLAAARARGGRVLEVHDDGRATLECAEGHRWSPLIRQVAARWCPACGGYARRGIDDARRAAARRGGTCLADAVGGASSVLEWRCGRGHAWRARLANVLAGQWCGQCARDSRRKRTRPTYELADVVALAESRGGKFLDAEYVNGNTLAPWSCAAGHIFVARTRSVRAGHWCPSCARCAPRTLADAWAAAASHGGECESKTLPNGTRSVLRWRCAEGHRWRRIFSGVLAGAWCKRCAMAAPPALALRAITKRERRRTPVA